MRASCLPNRRTLQVWGLLLAATLCVLLVAGCLGPKLGAACTVAECLAVSFAVGLVVRDTVVFDDQFRRAQAFTTTPGPNGWTIKDTSSAGTPTYLCSADGAVLTLAANSEAEIVTLYQNDVLIWLANKLQHVEFVLKVSGIDSVTTLVAGLASAQNDTADSVAANAWFRMEGSASTSALVVETDDGTTDLDDKATGTTLAAVEKTLRIDFTNGLSDVRFFVDGERVAASTTFDLSALSSSQGLQPFVQLQKASGTGTPAVTIRRIKAQYAVAMGA